MEESIVREALDLLVLQEKLLETEIRLYIVDGLLQSPTHELVECKGCWVAWMKTSQI